MAELCLSMCGVSLFFRTFWASTFTFLVRLLYDMGKSWASGFFSRVFVKPFVQVVGAEGEWEDSWEY